MTTPTPDLPDWTAGQQPVTVPTPIGRFTILHGGQTPPIDVSAFSSVFICQTTVTFRQLLLSPAVQISDGSLHDLGDPVQIEDDTLLDITGGWLSIINLDGAATAEVEVVGLGRVTPPSTMAIAGWQPNSCLQSIPSQVWTAGETTVFDSTNNVDIPQGPVYVYCHVTAAAVTGIVSAIDTSGDRVPLFDTGSFHVTPAGGLAIGQMVALPANVDGLEYTAEAPGTAGVTIAVTTAY